MDGEPVHPRYPPRVARSAVWTIVVAAGASTRFGRPKQYESLGGRRVLDWALDAARRSSEGVVLVVGADHTDTYEPEADVIVAGGATRSESVRCGLRAVPDGVPIIVVHDGARPFATHALFDAVIDAVDRGADGAVPAVPVADTIKQVDREGVVVATPDRALLVAVQTPQAFRAEMLRRAHRTSGESTDDAALVEAIGGRVIVVPGEAGNQKITVPADLEWARQRLSA